MTRGRTGPRHVRGDAGRSDEPAGCCGLILLVAVIAVIARFWDVVVLLFKGLVGVLLSVLIIGGALLIAGFALFAIVCFVTAVMETVWRGGPSPADSGGDPAYLAYHGGPGPADLRALPRACRSSLDEAPLHPAAAIALTGPLLLVHTAVLGCYLAGAWTAVVGLRTVDAGLLLVRRVRMTCPLCFRRLGYPAYECGKCGRVHRDIRPGRLGVVSRVCLCGTRLPTLLLFGSADLTALCPHCDEPLRHRPGEARELVLPLSGGAGAGKTRLMSGMYATLGHAAEGVPGAGAAPADPETRSRLEDGALPLDPDTRLAPTPPGRAVRGLPVRVTSVERTLVVHMFDAAGELFGRADATEELTYLGKATTFFMVVDPLAAPGAWDALTGAEQKRLAPYRSPAADPMAAYNQTAEEVERQFAMARRRVSRARLAIVVTRGDLIRGTALEPGADVEAWAEGTLGLGNVLRSARTVFGEVEVFPVSVVRNGGGVPDPSLGALLHWTLYREHKGFAALAQRIAREEHGTQGPQTGRPEQGEQRNRGESA